jgi:hypothetical protein
MQIFLVEVDFIQQNRAYIKAIFIYKVKKQIL